MGAALNIFFANPLLYIGGVFALCAALAFLIFLAGMGGGTIHLFTIHENANHMEHARTRAVWGLFLLAVLFVLWELLRWVGAVLS